MGEDKDQERKEKLFEKNIDFAVKILKKFDKITLGVFYLQMKDEYTCHETLAKDITSRMKSAGVINLPIEKGTEYIQLKEKASVVWEGWKKWQEGIEHDIKLPRTLDNKQLAWYNQTLSFNKWRECRAWLALGISAAVLIISVIKCSS
jgi:hypothetical protein